MKGPVILIVGAASGALLLAAAGASAHMGPLSRLVGTQSVTFGDEATGAKMVSRALEEPLAEAILLFRHVENHRMPGQALKGSRGQCLRILYAAGDDWSHLVAV